MNLNSFTITTYQDNIKNLPNQVVGQADMLKAMFDGRTDKEVKLSINGIVNTLLAGDVERADAAANGNAVNITCRSSRAEVGVEYTVLFDAPADFATQQVFSIDGASVAIFDMLGSPLESGWKKGAPVLLARRGNLAWLLGGGGVGNDAVARAVQAAQEAAIAANDALVASRTATAAAQKAQQVLEEGLIVIDPVTQLLVPVQAALDNLYNEMRNEGGISAGDYDMLELTADAYDAYAMTVTEYDMRAKTILGG